EGVELRVLAGRDRRQVNTMECMRQSRHPGHFADHDRIEFRFPACRAADDVDASERFAHWPVDAIVDVAAVQGLGCTGEQTDDVDGDIALPDYCDIPAQIDHGLFLI